MRSLQKYIIISIVLLLLQLPLARVLEVQKDSEEIRNECYEEYIKHSSEYTIINARITEITDPTFPGVDYEQCIIEYEYPEGTIKSSFVPKQGKEKVGDTIEIAVIPSERQYDDTVSRTSYVKNTGKITIVNIIRIVLLIAAFFFGFIYFLLKSRRKNETDF